MSFGDEGSAAYRLANFRQSNNAFGQMKSLKSKLSKVSVRAKHSKNADRPQSQQSEVRLPPQLNIPASNDLHGFFEYDPLPSNSTEHCIRLLHLQPARVKGTNKEEIRCFLEHTTLSAKHGYEALSYCWEPVTPKQSIICNGKMLSIGSNLFHALEELRFAAGKGSRLLWVDAICINQSDEEERSQQVQHMRLIYSKAKQTIIWLGPQAQHSSLGFRFASKVDKWLADELEAKAPHLLEDNDEPYSNLVLPYFKAIRDANSSGFIGLVELLSRIYFSRVWIIQEILVSRKILVRCPSLGMWFDTLTSAFEWILLDPDRYALSPRLKIEHEIDTVRFSTSLNNIWHLKRSMMGYQTGNPPSLTSAFKWYRRFQASDPRDKVFALIGISSMAGAENRLIIDYKMKVQDVFRAAVLYIIQHDRSLDVLGLPQSIGEPVTQDLPSWVPDLADSGIDIHSLGPQPGDEKDNFCRWECSQDSRTDAIVSKDEKSIAVSGTMVGLISRTGEVYQDKQWAKDMYPWADVVHSWIKTADEFLTQGKLPLREQDKDIIMRTVFSGTEKGLTELSAPLWDMYRCAAEKCLSSEIKKLDEGSRANLTMSLRNVSYWGRGRRLAASHDGHLALVPEKTKSGDSIALLKGGNTPFILRHQPKNNWIVVGEAFIHGMMSGEKFVDSECVPITLV